MDLLPTAEQDEIVQRSLERAGLWEEVKDRLREPGTSLSGGKGSILGTVLGAVIIGVLNNGLVLLNVSPFWQQVVKGGVILLAVIIDKANSKND